MLHLSAVSCHLPPLSERCRDRCRDISPPLFFDSLFSTCCRSSRIICMSIAPLRPRSVSGISSSSMYRGEVGNVDAAAACSLWQGAAQGLDPIPVTVRDADLVVS